MPPESINDQALSLKKRARRRLVGAIALVLMMLIILPNVLQDRTALEKRAPIKLTMMDPDTIHEDETVLNGKENGDDTHSEIHTESVISTEGLPEKIATNKTPTNESSVEIAKHESIKLAPPKVIEKKAITFEQEKKPAIHPAETKKPVVIDRPVKEEDGKPQRFLIQVGVYSDEANVKQLQSKITEAGFSSRAAKLKTDKGDKIRLRVGSFVTRDAAAEALKKLQRNGLSGMVLIDE